jgi:hypothetical protein
VQALGHITIWTYVLAIGSMVFKDASGTLLVVAEAKGRSVLAGLLDASSDLATVVFTLVGAGSIIVHGWTLQTIGILLAMMVTSFFGTLFWTNVGKRIQGDEHTHPELATILGRLEVIEAKYPLIDELARKIGLGG